MERLTRGVQNTYPVDRSIMDTESQPQPKESPKSRLESLVARVTRDKKNEAPKPGAKPVENPQFNAGSAGDGNFANFDAAKFKENKYLEELAKKIQMAGKKGEISDDFLGNIQQELNRSVQLGIVSDNWRYQFTDYLQGFVVEANIKNILNDPTEISKDIEAIVAERKKRKLTSEEAQASRIVWENALGRKLTDAEHQQIVTGKEAPSRTSEAFREQVSLIEKVADSPRRFDSFAESLERNNPETVRKVLNGKAGEVVLGVLLGDISERDVYIAEFRKIIAGDASELKFGLANLARKIQTEEKRVMPKVDPEKQRIAREIAQKWVEEQKKKRQVTAEEIEAVFNSAERGSMSASGGANGYEIGLLLMEEIESIPSEYGEAFIRVRADLVDNERIRVIAEEMYGVDFPRIQVETDKFLDLRSIDDPAMFTQRYRQLLTDLLRRHQASMSDPKREEERRQNEADARELTATGEKTKGGKTFNIKGLDEIVTSISPPKPGERPFFEREPRNIQEVAAWIMAGDDRSIWGPDGSHPIFKWGEGINPETGGRQAEFQAQNLILWLRNKALEHHADNPNDPLNLLQGISIETLFKSISILTMKYNKQKYFADEHGKPLSNLADEVINEAWLFGVRRNKNLGYIQAMNSDEKLFDAIVEMSGKNDHTGGTNLADLLQMGEDFDNDKKNKDNKVGDAMLAANQIYRNLSDIEKLYQVLPDKSPLFTVDGFKNASRYLNDQDFSETAKGYGNLVIEGDRVYFRDPRTKIRTEIFDVQGNLVSDKNLIKFLNFFPAANPEESNEKFVRELVKQSIAGVVGFDDGMDKEKYEKFLVDRKEKLGDEYKEVSIEEYRKITRMNLEWAETNSWVEQRWSGAAARNDTGYRGYDAWTKMYAQYYRERQSGPKTAGPIGNPHDMQIFRMLTPDMWLAIRTESGESVHEVFEELHMTNLKLYQLEGELTPKQEGMKKALEERKKAAYERLRFPRWTESDWASNGVNRQAQVWHNIMNTEDLKFNELVKKDTWGVLRYDRQKFEEVVKDDFIKKRRYAFSSNNAINYGAVTRMRVRDVVRDSEGKIVMEKGKPKVDFVYKDMYLAEAMFGEVVIGSIRDEWFSGKLQYEAANENGEKIMKKGPKKGEKYDPEKHGTFQGYLNSLAAREKILKNVCRAGLAAQIRAHRERTGTTERWDAEAVRKLYESMRSMPEYLEDPVTGKEQKIDDSQFFSEEDIDWIRKNTGTGRGKLLWEDSYHAGWDVAAESIPDILEMFYKEMIS